MYEVYLWVFSKGWKLLMRTRNAVDAYNKATEFLPYEVKITHRGRDEAWAGQYFTPGEVPEGRNTLARVLPADHPDRIAYDAAQEANAR